MGDITSPGRTMVSECVQKAFEKSKTKSCPPQRCVRVRSQLGMPTLQIADDEEGNPGSGIDEATWTWLSNRESASKLRTVIAICKIELERLAQRILKLEDEASCKLTDLSNFSSTLSASQIEPGTCVETKELGEGF